MLTSLFSALLISFAFSAPLKVLIDPGHGGTDTGAVYGAARESEISLKVAVELKKLIDQSQFFRASLTRTKEINISLQERVNMAELENADLFLSLHANASPDPRARGFELYFQNHLPPDEETLYLANTENQVLQEDSAQASTISKRGDVTAILEDLKRHKRMQESFRLSKNLLKAWGLRNSSAIRQAPFFVISKTNIPSVLVEMGYLTHAADAQKLIRPEFQKEIAKKIFQGLVNYKEALSQSATERLD
jgi:N-acetylmuramoyl-L-alanine amidase